MLFAFSLLKKFGTVRADYNMAVERRTNFDECYNYMSQNSDYFYFFESFSLKDISEYVIAKPIIKNYMMAGGWDYNMPLINSIFANLNSKNVKEAMMKDNVYWVMSDSGIGISDMNNYLETEADSIFEPGSYQVYSFNPRHRGW